MLPAEAPGRFLTEGRHDRDRKAAETSAFYAEYDNVGPGANAAGRVPWSNQLSETGAKEYTMANMFGDRNPGTENTAHP